MVLLTGLYNTENGDGYDYRMLDTRAQNTGMSIISISDWAQHCGTTPIPDTQPGAPHTVSLCHGNILKFGPCKYGF